MKNKGFTLIELLAVIVILAIIALIAAPIILGIINDAKKQADMRSAELYLKSAQLAIARANLTGTVEANTCSVIAATGNLNCGGTTVVVDMDGQTATSGTITFTNGKVTNVDELIISGQVFDTNTNGTLVASELKPYTGEIYRHSEETVMNGLSSIDKTGRSGWCFDFVETQTSCDLGVIFDSKSDCESVASAYGSDPDTCAEGTLSPALTSYEKDWRNVRETYYLKHDVVDDVITASYSCIKYTENGTLKQACVKGGDSSYYGSDNTEGNRAIIKSTEGYFTSSSVGGSCTFNDNSSYCGTGSFALNALSRGNVYSLSALGYCYVFYDGYSTCVFNGAGE